MCPGGDTARGTVLPALYADEAPAPVDGDTPHVTQYPDGAVVSYAPENHELRLALPSGGKVILMASTLNLDWTSWPGSPSYGAMMQELTRFA